MVYTAGFQRNRRRDLKIWDVRKLDSSSCLNSINIDTNPGVMFMHMDNDSKLLHLMGRGDVVANILDTSPSSVFFFMSF